MPTLIKFASRISPVLLAAWACMASTAANAAIVELTPATINQGDTNTTSFTDGFLTLTPFVGGTQATFNADPDRLGIDDFGTAQGAFVDPDTDDLNNNGEGLRFQFGPTAALARISYSDSRADGDEFSGVFISGFTADPLATLSGNFGSSSLSYAAGVLRLSLVSPSVDIVDLNFGNLFASQGQTLNLSVADTDTAGAAFSIRSIAYENSVVAIPEPGSLALIACTAAGLVARRRRSVRPRD